MKISSKQITIFAFLTAIMLLLLIPFLRYTSDQPLLAGDNSYYHSRIAEQIKQEGIPITDPLVQRPYVIEPYHLLLFLTSLLIGITKASIIIPLVCGLFSFVLFKKILEQLNIEQSKIPIILLVLVLSPVFIFLFATSNSYSLTLLIILLGFYLFIKNKSLISLLVFATIPFFGVLPSIITILILLVYSINYKSKLKQFYLILFTILILLVTYQLPFIFHNGLPSLINQSTFLTNLISDLGGNFGFGIFNILLALFGLYLVWNIKKQIIGYTLIIILLSSSFYIPQLNIFISFILAIFAGYGFSSIIEMKWKIKTIKKLTIFLIICGLLFSTLSYINRTAQSLPDQKTVESLKWLKDNTAATDIIFSDSPNGLLIQAVAKRSTILDSETKYIQNIKEKIKDSNTIFYSRDLEVTKKLLDKYNIKYIYVSPMMKNGQIWTKQEEGLLFLFRNSETFKKLYNRNNIEVWEYKG